jgi:hypothetical protein
MYKYILIPILLLLIGYTTIQAQPAPRTTPITFINENPGETRLGLAKFILNERGEKVDYKLLKLYWNYHIYVIDLEPGVYGVTQYVPRYDKIVGYQTITVGNEPMIVKFERLKWNQ